MIVLFMVKQKMIKFDFQNIFFIGDMCRIIDILLMMLLHSDTTRISIQQFDSVANQEYFLDSKDQILINSNFNHDADEMNEITFSLTFDDGNDDNSIHENETEQEEISEGKGVNS